MRRTREHVTGRRPGEAKLNVDGVVAAYTSHGVAGVVCYDENGTFIGASAFVFEGMEAYTCKKTFTPGADLGLAKICIASDCLKLVMDLNMKNGTSGYWGY